MPIIKSRHWIGNLVKGGPNSTIGPNSVIFHQRKVRKGIDFEIKPDLLIIGKVSSKSRK
jgi:hypothetical protein